MPEFNSIRGRWEGGGQMSSAMPQVKSGHNTHQQANTSRRASNQKENDPATRGLKRLSSITALTTPINQITSKFRRPSTAVPSKTSAAGQQAATDSSVPRLRQPSNTSRKTPLKTPPPSSRSAALPLSPCSAGQQPPLLVKSQTTSNLTMLTRRDSSYTKLRSGRSHTLLPRSRIPSPVSSSSVADAYKASKHVGASRAFAGLRKPGTGMPRSNTQPNLPLAAGLTTPTTPRRPSAFRGEALADVKEEPSENKHAFSIPRKQVRTPLRNASTSFGPSRKMKLPRSETTVELTAKPWEASTVKPAKRTWPRRSIEEEYMQDLLVSPSARKSESLENLQKSPLGRKFGSSLRSPRRSFEQDITINSLLQPISPPLPRISAGCVETMANPSFASAKLVRQVSQAQPDAYWAGRYISLNDRLVNESMAMCTSFQNPFDRKSSDEVCSMAASLDGEAHAQRIFDLLYAACVTQEAVESLQRFQVGFATLRHFPKLAFYVPKSMVLALANATDRKKTASVYRRHLSPISGNGLHEVSTTSAGVRQREMSVGSGSDATTSTVRSTEALLGSSLKKESFIDRLRIGKSRRATASAFRIREDGAGKEGLLEL